MIAMPTAPLQPSSYLSRDRTAAYFLVASAALLLASSTGLSIEEKVPAPSKPAVEEKALAGIPNAIPVPGKPGFVTSPHAPAAGFVDVRGFAPGTEVKCPYTGNKFLVP
jgi:hypothetical protein